MAWQSVPLKILACGCMVSPKVRPPIPHDSPKKKDQKRVDGGACASTVSKSFVIIAAMIHGAMIQLKTRQLANMFPTPSA
jgi:hypothetical protein